LLLITSVVVLVSADDTQCLHNLGTCYEPGLYLSHRILTTQVQTYARIPEDYTSTEYDNFASSNTVVSTTLLSTQHRCFYFAVSTL